MKKILTTSLVLVAMSACSAPSNEDETDVMHSAVLTGPGVWQLNRECGTQETGACPKPMAACDGAIGNACPTAGTRCKSAPTASGLRQVLVCNPTSNSAWTYNGDCANADCPNKPACESATNAGERCPFPLQRCAKNDGRIFVCLTNGKDQYIFSGYCGKNGGPACAGFVDCPQDEDGMAGLACDAVGSACRRKIDNLTGKVFTCVSR